MTLVSWSSLRAHHRSRWLQRARQGLTNLLSSILGRVWLSPGTPVAPEGDSIDSEGQVARLDVGPPARPKERRVYLLSVGVPWATEVRIQVVRPVRVVVGCECSRPYLCSKLGRQPGKERGLLLLVDGVGALSE